MMKRMLQRRKEAKLKKKQAKAASKLMGPPLLPGSSGTSIVAPEKGSADTKQKRKAASDVASAAKQAKHTRHVQPTIRAVGSGSNAAMRYSTRGMLANTPV